MKALFGDGANSKYTLPPFPHPLPERSLSLYCTSGGVYIVPARPTQKPSTTSTTFRKHHLPRTSISSTTEDVAHDIKLARRNSISKLEGARIGWGRTGAVKAVDDEEVKRAIASSSVGGEEILCYGVLGIQRLFNDAYLLVITSRTLVGDYLDPGRPVYKCSGVLIIPLSFERAREVFATESNRQKKAVEELERKTQNLSVESEQEEEDTEGGDVVTPSVISKEAFIDGDQVSKDGSATVKASKSRPWLQRHTRHASENTPSRLQGAQPTDEPSSSVLPPISVESIPSTTKIENHLSAEEQWHEATKAELESKVVKETARQYSRGEMFFAYDFDLTTPLQRKQDHLEAGSKGKSRPLSASSFKANQGQAPFSEPFPTLPLWRRADSRFWHNEAIGRDFVEAGLHGLVLPMMQGYFQVTSLPLDDGASSPSDEDGIDPMDAVSQAASSLRLQAQLLIISRRSKERAGLRYQRRGLNEKGQVANYVETEQILYLKRGEEEYHAVSFLQFRGSIPQYWKQDPFSMKPPPILERNAMENRTACSKHFEAQLIHHGKVICINLAEQHGKEGAITRAYKDAVSALDTEKVQYIGFDFHEECKGMKFENISKLIDKVKDQEIVEMDCFWKRVGGGSRTTTTNQRGGGGETVLSRQKSAFRISCLDCLDRTNVVQSAFGRYLLHVQLQRLGIERDVVKNEEFDFAFNDSWANNGDMISQIYAGTRALKGDFTRTGKRNLMGMMNDATNSVYRMVQGAVTDFFKQTVIDFQYGQISLAALERYNDDLAAQDPSESHRLARVRTSAIETCAKDVIPKEEQRVAGWTLFSPIQPNRIQSSKLEEKIMLLTNKSIYVCGYDFTTEMLVEFSKIKLGDVIKIKRGVYILSPHEGYHPENHWGLLIEYLNEERRLNTASMKNVPPRDSIPSETNFVAFRAVIDDFAALPPSPPITAEVNNNNKKWNLFSKSTALEQHESRQSLTSHSLVDSIVATLAVQCEQAGAFDQDDASNFIQEETIQSLAQAKATAPLFGPLIEGLKRRLWL